jgi:hypothetical protein
LYGIGAGRDTCRGSRLAVDDRVRGFADALKRNLFALKRRRVVPGVVFIAFIAWMDACHWAFTGSSVSALSHSCSASWSSSATRSTIVPIDVAVLLCVLRHRIRAATGLCVPGRLAAGRVADAGRSCLSGRSASDADAGLRAQDRTD